MSSGKLSSVDITNIDKWIEQLKGCRPLEESQVKTLCDKVNIFKNNIIKQCPRNKKKFPKRKFLKFFPKNGQKVF